MIENISVFDVAAYILRECGPMHASKLHGLCYYSKAWGLVWDKKPIFNEAFAAYRFGPTCPELQRVRQVPFSVIRSQRSLKITRLPRGRAKRIKGWRRSTIDSVLKAYGELTGEQLKDLSVSEAPWKDARKHAREWPAPCNIMISDESMSSFYAAIPKS